MSGSPYPRIATMPTVHGPMPLSEAKELRSNWSSNFDHNLQVVFNGLHDRFGSQILILILAFMVLAPFYVAYRIRNNS